MPAKVCLSKGLCKPQLRPGLKLSNSGGEVSDHELQGLRARL